jgi:hypothetical protein
VILLLKLVELLLDLRAALDQLRAVLGHFVRRLAAGDQLVEHVAGQLDGGRVELGRRALGGGRGRLRRLGGLVLDGFGQAAEPGEDCSRQQARNGGHEGESQESGGQPEARAPGSFHACSPIDGR